MQPALFASLLLTLPITAQAATSTPFGNGCMQCRNSIYEYFGNPATFDLTGNSVSFVPSADGYVLVPSGHQFVAPTVGATQLSVGGDGVVAAVLNSPFRSCTGPATTIWIHANGAIALAAGNTCGPTPQPSTLLNSPAAAFWCWRDLDPGAVGGGSVWLQEVGTRVYVTWQDVWNQGGTSAAAANRFQWQLDWYGSVDLVVETMSPQGGPILVGYSNGGPSSDPGSADLSWQLPTSVCCIEQSAMKLLSKRPVRNTTPLFSVQDIPAGFGFGVLMFGLAPTPWPIDGAVLGAPGCTLLIQPVDFVFLPPPSTVQFVPWAFWAPCTSAIGFTAYAQALTFPGPGTAGRTSNALELVVGAN